ncbi:hypothetical protein [Stenotrophomonas forensis]
MEQPVVLRSSARTRLRVVAAALLSLASGHVMACTSSGAIAAYLTADLKFPDAPRTITMLSGPDTGMKGWGTPRAHQLAVPLEHFGLKAVSTIDYQGKTYVTYEVQLLRNGTPVNLGQHLQARHTRVPGALKIGDVEGQSAITASYRHSFLSI